MLANESPLLGILGGLGPLSTVYFYDMLTRHTAAACDAEHLNILISSHATTPDRTAFILGQSDANPLDVMLSDARRLVNAGAELLVIPCNTAHYFYAALQEQLPIPVLNIIRETVAYLHGIGARHPAILATEGTVRGGGYQKICAGFGMDCEEPTPDEQAALTELIYGRVKRGVIPDAAELTSLGEGFLRRGCDALIIGCTELSLIPRDTSLPFTDSLEVLACATIARCGKTPIGFPPAMLSFAADGALTGKEAPRASL